MTEAHVRIDEGLKRGPRKKAKQPKTALEGPQRVLSVALRPLHQIAPEERQRIANSVLDAYINGEQVKNIAPQYGVSDVTIYALLLREHQESWKDIQTARALARLERSQDEIRNSQDALSLARAREEVRSAQWELERLLNRLYAVKQEVTVDINHHISVDQALSLEAGKLADRIRGVAPMPNAALLPSILDVEQVDDSE